MSTGCRLIARTEKREKDAVISIKLKEKVSTCLEPLVEIAFYCGPKEFLLMDLRRFFLRFNVARASFPMPLAERA